MVKVVCVIISDVVKVVKIGKISILCYFNGEKYLFFDDLLLCIEKVIVEFDYCFSLMVCGFKYGWICFIGLIIVDIINFYLVNVMSGIEVVCWEKGFILLVCNINNEFDQELYYLDLLCSYQVEGIVVNVVGMWEDGLNCLQQLVLLMVLIDCKIFDFVCDVVGFDNVQVVIIVIEYLVEKGFEVILFFSELLGLVNICCECLSVFCVMFVCYYGVVVENVEVQFNDGVMLDNVLCQFYVCYCGMCKVVIFVNGVLMLQVVCVLKCVGLIWGSDIGLLGFDELEWVELVGVGIIIFKQLMWQIGYVVVEQVIWCIVGINDFICEWVFFGEFIVCGLIFC